MQKKPNATDLGIIEILRTNPRITNKEIAVRLDLSETTVAQRLKSMADNGIMRVVAQRHIFSEGFSTLCFLFVDTSGRTVQSVSKEIAAYEEVLSISQGIGNPDIFASVRAKSLEQAHRLACEIGRIRGVHSIESVPCFRISRYDSDVGDLTVRTPLSRRRAGSTNDEIIHALFCDGRQSNREIARQLGLSESAIRQRLKKLLQSGEMQFQVVCDPIALGSSTFALFRIRCNTHRTQQVLQKLIEHEAVVFVGEVTGEHNILAAAMTKGMRSLGNLCDNELLSTEGVESLKVQLLVANSKHEYHLAYFHGQENIPRRK